MDIQRIHQHKQTFDGIMHFIESDDGKEHSYMINTNTKKFHLPDCSSANDIADQNRETTDQTRDELIAEGYEPCGRCNP